jgi:DNA adenine methylase
LFHKRQKSTAYRGLRHFEATATKALSKNQLSPDVFKATSLLTKLESGLSASYSIMTNQREPYPLPRGYMRYLGGKARLATRIANEIHKVLSPDQPFYDVFCGAGHIVSSIKGTNRHANDLGAIVHLLEAVANGWEPPTEVTYEEYHEAKKLPTTDPMYAFVGYGCSFAGVLWGTYARDKGGTRSYAGESARSLKKAATGLQGVKFTNLSYLELSIPDNAVIYCDPPYAGTTGYGLEFNQDEFYEWVANQRCTVLISEYDYNPLGLEAVLEISYKRNLKDKEGVRPTVTDYLRIKPATHTQGLQVPSDLD